MSAFSMYWPHLLSMCRNMFLVFAFWEIDPPDVCSSLVCYLAATCFQGAGLLGGVQVILLFLLFTFSGA